MGARTFVQQLPVARTVGDNIATLRALRGWTLRELEARTERAGHRLDRNCIREIELGHSRSGATRMVTVDQLMVLAAVFRVAPVQLLHPDLGLPRGSASARGPQTMPETGHNRP
jgi:transcriptional regulator with XRE-family HTH domain